MLHSGQVSSQYLRFQDCYFQEPASSYSLCRGPWTFNSGIRILLRGIAASTCGDAEVLLYLALDYERLQSSILNYLFETTPKFYQELKQFYTANIVLLFQRYGNGQCILFPVNGCFTSLPKLKPASKH